MVFVLMNLVPGGPFTLADRGYSGAALENLERKYGLDKPIHIRYINYMTSAVHLDFGNSFSVAGNPPVTELIARIWPVTFQLGFYTILLSFGVGITLGIIAAYYHNSIIDNLVTFVATAGHRRAKFYYRHLAASDFRFSKRLGRGEQVDYRSHLAGWLCYFVLGLLSSGIDLCTSAAGSGLALYPLELR